MLDTVKYKLFTRKKKWKRKKKEKISLISVDNSSSENFVPSNHYPPQVWSTWRVNSTVGKKKRNTSGRREREREIEGKKDRCHAILGPLSWRRLGRLRRSGGRRIEGGGTAWRCITKPPLTALFMPPRKTCRVPEHTARMSLLSPHVAEREEARHTD